MLAGLFHAELDMVLSVAEFLPFKPACLLSQTNKHCRQRLADLRSTRYTEIIRACPWMSKPQRLTVRMPSPDGRLGLPVNTHTMCWGVGPDNQSLAVQINGHTFTCPMYGHQDGTFRAALIPEHYIVITDAFRTVSDEDRETLRDAGIVERYSDMSIRVMNLDDDVSVARWYGRDQSGWALSFYSRADRRHLFHASRVQPCYPTFLSRPGELWIPDQAKVGVIWYYGPREDRSYADDIAPRLFPAQCFARNGEIQKAIAALKGNCINTRFSFNETLLLAFAKYASHNEAFMKRIDMLHRAGADMDVKDSDNETVLSMTIDRGAAELVAGLLERGASIPRGTLLSVVSREVRNCSKIVRVLLAHRSDVNERCRVGETPLMVAVRNVSPHVVDVLLECGADPMLRNDRGQRAIDLVAVEAGKRRRNDIYVSLSVAMVGK